MGQIEQAAQLNTEAPLTLHIVVASFFVITGTAFNGLIIYLKLRKSNIQETDVYIVALACVDIFQCIIMCPQYPFMVYYIAEYWKHRPLLLYQEIFCAYATSLIYLQLLTLIAMHRAYAVFKPYTF